MWIVLLRGLMKPVLGSAAVRLSDGLLLLSVALFALLIVHGGFAAQV